MSLFTTQAVADRLGVTIARVQQLIWEGKLPAQKIGRDYVVNEADIEKVKHRKRGRPPARPAENSNGQQPMARKKPKKQTKG